MLSVGHDYSSSNYSSQGNISRMKGQLRYIIMLIILILKCRAESQSNSAQLINGARLHAGLSCRVALPDFDTVNIANKYI